MVYDNIMNKKKLFLLIPLLAAFPLTACDAISEILDGDTKNIHKQSFDAVTGTFVLHEAADKRYECHDTYFVIDGSKGNFSLKYYENGNLKRDGKFQRVVTYEEKIGKKKDNLHFNIKSGNLIEHISTYTESLDPINQFRIIEEYKDSNKKYYLSELPFVMGTYVRQGAEYKEESPISEGDDYTSSTLECYTASLNGYFKLDEEHYFYFLFPNINGFYAFSYFQYYSPSLNKPLEGFAQGRTYVNTSGESRLVLTYSREVLFDKSYQDTANNIVFGYYSFDEKDNMLEHFGTIDFSNGELHSFSFEHLSRNWTDEEWDLFTKDQNYHMPDPIFYEYIGGTYYKV